MLVALVVLVVPVFLDGSPGETETLSERVPLPGQADPKTQTVVLDRDRAEPVPARTTAEPVSGREEAAAETPAVRTAAIERAPADPEPNAEPPAKRAETESTPRPAASATGMWAVQLGSFSQVENAEKLAAGLRKQGFAAFLSQLDTDEGLRHRVRIGPQKDREAAEAMAARLAAAGHEGQVVPHP